MVHFQIIWLLVAMAARFLISATCAKKFLKLSTQFQNSIRKNLHAEIFNKEISSGELLTLIFETVQTLDEVFVKVLPQIFSVIILLPLFLIAANGDNFIGNVANFATAFIFNRQGDR